MMTKAQKIDAAQKRMEERMCELLEASEMYNNANQQPWDRRIQRKQLLHHARLYARAVDHLRRSFA